MGRSCTICALPQGQREEIDSALIAGVPVVRVASRYFTIDGKALGRMAMQRHKDDHLPATLAKAEAAKEISRADDLLAQVRTLQARALAILDTAEGAGDLKTALAAIREARGCIELFGRLAGELQEGATVNIVISPEWQRVRAVIIAHLAPFPDARAAVASGLLALEAGTP